MLFNYHQALTSWKTKIFSKEESTTKPFVMSLTNESRNNGKMFLKYLLFDNWKVNWSRFIMMHFVTIISIAASSDGNYWVNNNLTGWNKTSRNCIRNEKLN